MAERQSNGYAWPPRNRTAWADGLPLAPPEAGRVAALLASAPGQPDRVVAGRGTVGELAVIAAMAGCPDAVFPTALAAVERFAEQWNGHWPVLVAERTLATNLGLNSGYGALSSGHANLALGRTVTLALRAWFDLGGTTISHPGEFSAVAAERDDTPVPIGAPGLWLAACGPLRGAYVGGGRGSIERITEILADSIAAGLPPVSTPSIAVLVTVSPPTAAVAADAGRDAFVEALITRVRALNEDCDVRQLDVLLVALGGETQTWCAIASGPPGSAWVHCAV